MLRILTQGESLQFGRRCCRRLKRRTQRAFLNECASIAQVPDASARGPDARLHFAQVIHEPMGAALQANNRR